MPEDSEDYYTKRGNPAMNELPNEIVQSFINLTEKIANSKTNVLNFGSEDMTFYRGEIHIIQMIGDSPGTFSSEIARKFGITRAVVHKTLLKLEERKLVLKQPDDTDKKRVRLFLSEKGIQAYHLHREYHNTHDKALFEYIDNLDQAQLEAINGFLIRANLLIENHA